VFERTGRLAVPAPYGRIVGAKVRLEAVIGCRVSRAVQRRTGVVGVAVDLPGHVDDLGCRRRERGDQPGSVVYEVDVRLRRGGPAGGAGAFGGPPVVYREYLTAKRNVRRARRR